MRETFGDRYTAAVDAALDVKLMSLEEKVDKLLLQALREARKQAAETQMGEGLSLNLTLQRQALEAALLDAVQSARLAHGRRSLDERELGNERSGGAGRHSDAKNGLMARVVGVREEAEAEGSGDEDSVSEDDDSPSLSSRHRAALEQVCR